MVISMGFQSNYVTRAFKVYEKNYGYSYNVEVITEIIVRLQNKDKARNKDVRREAISFILNKMDWKWTEYVQQEDYSFYACIAEEIFGVNDLDRRMQIRSALYRYMLLNSENKAYFKTILETYDIGFAVQQKPFAQHLQDTPPALYSEVVAAAELYNVRIIVFEIQEKLFEYSQISSKAIAPGFCAYCSCINIPLVLLTKIGNSWGRIRAAHDVGHLVHCNMKLTEYQKVVNNLQLDEVAVKNVCARWFGRGTSVPGELIQIIVRLLPSFMVRPIGLSEQRGLDEQCDLNEQMKNRRNEVKSYMHVPKTVK